MVARQTGSLSRAFVPMACGKLLVLTYVSLQRSITQTNLVPQTA